MQLTVRLCNNALFPEPNICAVIISDNSGCVGGQTSVTVPYITDTTGQFVTNDLRDIHNNSSQTIFISIRWRGDTLRLVLEPHEITTLTSTAEWMDDSNATNAEQLQMQNERFYQGHVKGRRFSFIAVSMKYGLVSLL